MAGLLPSLRTTFFAGRRRGRAIDRRRSLALSPVRNPEVTWQPVSPAEGQVSIQIPLQRRPVPKPLI